MGTHMRVLSKSFPMNTNMTGFRWFLNIFATLDESSLSIGRVNSIVTQPNELCLLTVHAAVMARYSIALLWLNLYAAGGLIGQCEMMT